MLTIPGMKEMEIKTTLRFHLTPVRMAIIKNTTTVGENAGKKEPSSCRRESNHCGKQYGGFSKIVFFIVKFLEQF
jgi:hypothetical protein